MTIEIVIRIQGNQIDERFNDEECTMGETALAVYTIERMKQMLIEDEFESEFKMERT